jgi:ribosomal protein S18 acetylase RimI-like enzyme
MGFEPADRRLSQFQWRPAHVSAGQARPAMADPESADPARLAWALPRGYVIRPLAGRHEIAARVEAHRAAFPPSRLTIEKYERLLTLPHYRFEDDLVIEAPDGSFAAFAMAWWDPDGRVGEFEPVGTHPAHRRRGLSRALLTWGLQRYAERGARVVQVYSDAAYPAAEALYETLGFARRAFHRRYQRPGGAAPDLQSGP